MIFSAYLSYLWWVKCWWTMALGQIWQMMCCTLNSWKRNESNIKPTHGLMVKGGYIRDDVWYMRCCKYMHAMNYWQPEALKSNVTCVEDIVDEVKWGKIFLDSINNQSVAFYKSKSSSTTVVRQPGCVTWQTKVNTKQLQRFFNMKVSKIIRNTTTKTYVIANLLKNIFHYWDAM